MTKSLVTLLILLLLFNNAKCQTWEWAIQSNSSQNSSTGGISIDENGNTYQVGKFSDSIIIGTTILHSQSGNSIFIAKYDVNGNSLWARVAANDSAITVTGVDLTRQGRISIIGNYFGTAEIGDQSQTQISSVGDYDIYIAQYDSSGSLLWVQSAGETGFDYGSRISNDDAGNVYFTGDYHLSSFIGSGSKIVLAKFDLNGNLIWFVKPATYTSTDFAADIKTDSAGNSYFTGEYFGTLTFDSVISIIAGNPEANIYVGKISPGGQILWLQTAGGAGGYCSGNAIDIDQYDNCYITGYFHGTISVGSYSLSGTHGIAGEVFVAKSDLNGNFVWAKQIHGIGLGKRICADYKGGCIIAGTFSDTLNAGSSTFYNIGANDLFIAGIDSNGVVQTAISLGANDDVNIGGLQINANSVYIAGNFIDTLPFDNSHILTTANTGYNTFIAKTDFSNGINVPDQSVYIRVFPNPSCEIFNIQLTFKKAENISIVVCDAVGREIKTIDTGNHSRNEYDIQIPTELLSSGTYFLKLTTATQVLFRKIIKL